MKKPIAYFSYTISGLTVKFNNLSLGNPTKHRWDFGDNTTSTDLQPEHTYSEPGVYDVKLVISQPTEDELNDPNYVAPSETTDNTTTTETTVTESGTNQTITTEGEATDETLSITLEEDLNLDQSCINELYDYTFGEDQDFSGHATLISETVIPVAVCTAQFLSEQPLKPLIQQVFEFIPPTVRDDLNTQNIINVIRGWQLYLQPLVEVPHKIPEQHTHNERFWPTLSNVLISKLVAYDIMLQSANQLIVNAGLSGGSTGEGTVDLKPQIKTIETGPTKIEKFENVYDLKDTEKIKNLSQIYRSLLSPHGILVELKRSICQSAMRVGVYLPVCENKANIKIVPRVISNK